MIIEIYGWYTQVTGNERAVLYNCRMKTRNIQPNQCRQIKRNSFQSLQAVSTGRWVWAGLFPAALLWWKWKIKPGPCFCWVPSVALAFIYQGCERLMRFNQWSCELERKKWQKPLTVAFLFLLSCFAIWCGSWFDRKWLCPPPPSPSECWLTDQGRLKSN